MKTKQKEKILSIPVIGHLAALGKLPRMIKTLQELMKETDRLKQLEQETESAVEERNRIAEERWTAATATFDSLGGSIRDVQEQASARDRASEERWKATTAFTSARLASATMTTPPWSTSSAKALHRASRIS